MVSGLMGSVSRDVNDLLLGMGGPMTCYVESTLKQVEDFGDKFSTAVNPDCTVALEASQGCTVSKIFCGDWTYADWYCEDKRTKTYTYNFKVDGEEYDVRGVIGNTFVLFHNGEYATEVGVSCDGFVGKKEDVDLLKILKKGVYLVTGEEIKIHLIGDCGIWGCGSL